MLNRSKGKSLLLNEEMWIRVGGRSCDVDFFFGFSVSAFLRAVLAGFFNPFLTVCGLFSFFYPKQKK